MFCRHVRSDALAGRAELPFSVLGYYIGQTVVLTTFPSKALNGQRHEKVHQLLRWLCAVQQQLTASTYFILFIFMV